MRAVAIAVGLLLPVAGLAPPSWALSRCPGITEKDDQIGVHLASQQSCTGSTCSAGPSSPLAAIAGPLCTALSFLQDEAECGRCDCCRDLTFDLFTGTDLQLVGPDATNFCGLGNRGQPMGEAALCLLRDLAEPARSPSIGGAGIHLKRMGQLLGVGGVSVEQHIGFVDFNLPARRMRGFHAVSVCAPVLGCVKNQVQPFTATLQQVVGPVGPCGDYQFRTPWILRVETEQLEQNVGFQLPRIPIYTPLGRFDVQPLFGYELNLEAVTSPWAAGNHGTSKPADCATTSNLRDVVDADGGMFASILAAVVETFDGAGWDARLGLGTRDPDPEGQVWVPPPIEFPERPDFDFTVARQDAEKRPTGRLHTGIEVTYPIGDLAPKLNLGALKLTKAEAFVNSALDAAFVSQFALGVDEGTPGTPPPDHCGPAPETRVIMQSAIDALASIDITAGLRIEFELDLGFTSKTFRFNPTVHPVPLDTVDFMSAMHGPDAFAEMTPDRSPPNTASYETFISFSGGAENGNAFVDACLVEPPPPPQMMPTPVTEPGDPRDLIAPQEFPCNICLFFPSLVTQACLPRPELVAAGLIPADYDKCDLAINGMPCTDPNCSNQTISPPVPVDLKEVLFGVSQAGFPANERWMCDAFEKFGCYDLCRYDPKAADPLTITQSAVTKIGPRCRDATGGSDPSPDGVPCLSDGSNCNDGNPCTTDECRLEGEFFICRITQSAGPCDDGLFCNGADSCALGICGAHAGNACAVAGACCDEQTDTCPASCPRTSCEGRNASDPCDDGSACTLDDHCDPTSGSLICRGTAALSCPDTTCIAGICADVDGTAMCVEVPSGFCPPECGDGDLDPDEECDGTSDAACPGRCQPDCSCLPPGKMTGEPCTTPSQCASGFCVSGVCCGSACDAAGERCDLPGQAGSCVTIAAPVPALSATALLAGLGLLLVIANLAMGRRRN